MSEGRDVVRTVSGDVPPADLGATLAHEHLILRAPPALADDPGLSFGTADGARAELERFAAAGGGALAEMTTPEFGRDPAAMRAAASAAGVHVIASTGRQKGTIYPPEVASATIDALAASMVRDISVGIERSGACAGVIKIGTGSTDGILAAERRVFAAAASAQLATGVPISTHLQVGELGHEQLDELEGRGIEPTRVLLGHLDRRLDWEYHRSLAERGAWLGYDQLTKSKYAPDAERAALIGRLLDAGHTRVLISGDLGRSTYQPAYGGEPGFAGVLRRAHELFDEATAELLLVTNPASFFSFRPSTSAPRTQTERRGGVA